MFTISVIIPVEYYLTQRRPKIIYFQFFGFLTEIIVLATIYALKIEGIVNTGLTEEIADKLKISRERNDKTN